MWHDTSAITTWWHETPLMARTRGGGFGYHYFVEVEGYFRVIQIGMLKEKRKVDRSLAFPIIFKRLRIKFRLKNE